MIVTKFTGGKPPSEDDQDKLHSKAFCDLEAEVCDLDRLGEITNGMMVDLGNEPDNQRRLELAWTMVQVLAARLKQFKVDYYAAWEGKRQRSE
jgi:hypothetical protein